MNNELYLKCVAGKKDSPSESAMPTKIVATEEANGFAVFEIAPTKPEELTGAPLPTLLQFFQTREEAIEFAVDEVRRRMVDAP